MPRGIIPKGAQIYTGVPKCYPGVTRDYLGVTRCYPGVPRGTQAYQGVFRDIPGIPRGNLMYPGRLWGTHWHQGVLNGYQTCYVIAYLADIASARTSAYEPRTSPGI